LVAHLECEFDGSSDEGDSFTFADGVVASIQDNQLVGIKAGETYVQKYVAASNNILLYKVIVGQ
jgi:hypothetical protein